MGGTRVAIVLAYVFQGLILGLLLQGLLQKSWTFAEHRRKRLEG